MSYFPMIKTFTGTVEYPRVFEHDRDLGSDDNPAAQTIQARGGRYKLNFYPDDQSLVNQWFKEANVSLAPMGHNRWKKKDGQEYLIPHRDHNHVVTRDGDVLEGTGGAPRVVDADGNPWDEDVPIGNWSRIEIALEVWPLNTSQPRNIRLKAIKVLEHVPFEKSSTVEEGAEWAIG